MPTAVKEPARRGAVIELIAILQPHTRGAASMETGRLADPLRPIQDRSAWVRIALADRETSWDRMGMAEMTYFTVGMFASYRPRHPPRRPESGYAMLI